MDSLLWEFLKSVADHSLFWVGVVLTVVPFWEKVRKRSFASRSLWTLAGVCVLWACFSSWKDEKQRAQRVIDESEHNLSGEIGDVAYGYNSEPDDDEIEILVPATISNLGAPTIVHGYRLRVRLPQGTAYHLVPVSFDDGLMWLRRDGTPVFSRPIPTSESLFVKTASSPIERGGSRTGWLRYLLRGVDPKELNRPGILLTLHFQDITGKTFSVEKKLEKQVASPRLSYPGSIQPFGCPPSCTPIPRQETPVAVVP